MLLILVIWQTSGGTPKSHKKECKHNCQKRDGRQVGERKKQPKTHPKTYKNRRKWGLGPSRGLSEEARGPVWPQGGPGLEKGTKKPRNPTPFLALKWRPCPTFRGFFFQCFLRCSRCRFFMILGARGGHFGFHFGFILRALGLWRNS